MKITEFTRSDGTTGTNCIPEVNDKFTALEPKVREYENLAIVKGKPVKIYNRILRVQLENGNETELKLTEGHKKVLDKTLDLTNKVIMFDEYIHKEYGKLIGARVL